MCNMSDDSKDPIRLLLQQSNPWWDDSPFPKTKHTRAYFHSLKRLVFDWDTHRTIILMGPRRVGKTVMLRQLIQHAIDSKIDPRYIMFVSVDDPVFSKTTPRELLFKFEKITDHSHTDRRIVIFDEIQNLENWEAHMKALTDSYPNTRFVASGSAAATLRRRSQESGAGRFTDFFLPPLTFAEYLDFRNQTENLIIPSKRFDGLKYETTDIEKLNREFIDYINYGGYPETTLKKNIRQNAYFHLRRYVIDEVLQHDLAALYGIHSPTDVNNLLTFIAFNTGQETSATSISRDTGISRNTVVRYLEYLEAAFLVARVRRVDDTIKTMKRKSTFKLYITNSSMRAAFFGPASEEDRAELGHLVETAVLGHYHQYNHRNGIHYARYKSGRSYLEVDFVRIEGSSLRPFEVCEVKWSDNHIGNPTKLKGILDVGKRISKGIPIFALTKTVSSIDVYNGVEVKYYPCALYCYQVGLMAIERRAPWSLLSKDEENVDPDLQLQML